MNKVNNNIKFYTFIDILSTYSDEYTSISIKEINHHMNNKIGVTLDRRTVYSYNKLIKQMQLLQECIDYIDWKQNFYDGVLSGKTKYFSNLINMDK